MCGFGGSKGSSTPIYQAPTTPAPVTAQAVELKEEDDLVTNDADKKKKNGRDSLRTDLSDPLGIGNAQSTTKKTGLNLFN